VDLCQNDRMSLSAGEIGLVVKVLKEDLVGAVVRQVISPRSLDRIAIEFRSPGENHFLQIVAAAGVTRLGRVKEKPEARETPHPFVMLLRREIVGKVIVDILQIGDDRAVRFELAGKTGNASLVCELTSRHANIFLTNAEDLIMGSLFPNRSHKRKLVPSEPYVPPIPRAHMSEKLPSRFEAGPGLEERIEEHYLKAECASLADQDAAEIRRSANAVARHLDRILEKLEADLSRAKDGDRLANFGHLLKANLRSAKKGAANLEVLDFGGEKAVIPLDPKLGPVQNMEQLFNRAKRLKRAVPKIEERKEKISSDREWIAKALEQIEESDSERLADLRRQIRSRFPNLKARPKKRGRDTNERLPFKEFAISNGRTARVGRSARDNDALTLRFARPDDLWLHARGRPGSNVVVPMGRGEDPTPELLVDAAHLAAHFSDARGDVDVEVVCTRRRYVQKPKGAQPGSVRLINEKTVTLRVEQGRLERILNFNQD
jgi:predicted ribosome quality control (RQC) complex YloA/Tae2 family protein